MSLCRHLLLLLILVATLGAQSARWEPSGGSLALNRSSELQLVFVDCDPQEEVKVPTVDGLVLSPAGQMSSTNIVNGRVTQSTILGFNVRPTRETTLTLPSFRVKTDKGAVTVPAATFSVSQAAAAGGSIPLDSVARSEFRVPVEVWRGEVFPIEYRLTALRRYLHQAASDLTWDPAPLVLEDWPQLSAENVLSGGEKQIVLRKASRAFAATPGTVNLAPGTQLINIVTGTSAFGFFTSPNLEQFAITTAPATVRVKPLPAGAPATFTGAVGDFELKSKVVPERAQVGEPVTWTLTASGTGNWPEITGLPSREVSTQFRAVQTQPKKNSGQGKLFDATLEEDVVLVPTAPGTYTFGPFEWTVFDPKAGEYRTIRTPAHTVTIVSATAQPGGGGPGAGQAPRASASAPPGLPAPVPGGALEAAVPARAPFAGRSWLLALGALPFVLVLPAWALLATARARRLDPRRPARAARLRALELCSSLSEQRAAPAALPLLADWQAAVIQALELPSAYPGAAALEAHPELRKCWLEAEACRFGRAASLPADWPERARAALEKLPPAAFAWSALAKPRSWWPAALLALAAVLPTTDLWAEDNHLAKGLAAYDRGDFVAAEAAWRTALEREPLLSSAHLNLSLALSQQAQWQEATAHATLAFLQAPDQPGTLRQLRYCLSQPAFTPQEVEPLIADTATAGLVRTFTPRGWQLAGLAAAAAVSVGIILLLLVRLGFAPKWMRIAAGSLALAGLLGLPIALYSWAHYGTYRDPRAVLVWRETSLFSVPTDADAEQRKASLEAGTVATAQRSFLSWTEIRFRNGDTGWVQTSEVLPVWRGDGSR
ncbi:MAG: BatD family protein [Opitutaceae bacterium]|nr:BatD family protein [Opitutaceae bacterium]